MAGWLSVKQCHLLSAGGPLPADMTQGHVKSPILPSASVPLASFLGPVGADRENSAMGTQVPQLTSSPGTPPTLPGLSTSILGSAVSGLQKPKQMENGPPLSGVSREAVSRACWLGPTEHKHMPPSGQCVLKCAALPASSALAKQPACASSCPPDSPLGGLPWGTQSGRHNPRDSFSPRSRCWESHPKTSRFLSTLI